MVLVPGFGGFDALGSLHYYCGVSEVLRALETKPSGNRSFAVHYFPNLPTASVQTRARKLRSWLTDKGDEEIFQEHDRLHLVGHSTGGLDIRQLLIDLGDERKKGKLGDKDRQLLETITSAQFLSTPHRGTTLAHHFGSRRWRRGVVRLAMNGCYHWLRLIGERGSSWQGRLGKWVWPRTQADDWWDAVFDTLSGTRDTCGSLERANACESFFDLLHWLRNAASDSSVLTDLDPCKPGPGAPASPAHQDEGDEESSREVRFLEERGISLCSYVSRSRRPSLRLASRWPLSLLPWAGREGSSLLYLAAYWLTALGSPERLKARVVKGLEDSTRYQLEPSDNDGIVNSVSQVWPDEEHSCLVEGDHADVMGHFQSPPTRRDGDSFAWHQYDLLGSESGFDQKAFETLWRRVGTFALNSPHPRS